MARLDLPPQEMNRFDLAEVCLVTGSEDAVSWRRVTFRWYPRWLLILLVPSLLLGAIVIEVMTKRVRGELPFSDEGWRRHRVAGIATVLSGLFGISGIVAALFLLAVNQLLAAGIVGAVSVAGPVAVYFLWVRGRRVTCREITPLFVRLEVPSDGAADAIDRYRHAGTQIPMPAVPIAAEAP